jgi:hypothetical protein
MPSSESPPIKNLNYASSQAGANLAVAAPGGEIEIGGASGNFAVLMCGSKNGSN